MTYDATARGRESDPFELYLFQTVGSTFALTSSDTPTTYNGQVYTPSVISRGEIDQSQELTAGQLKIQVQKSSPIAQMFIAYLPPSPMRLTIFAGHRADGEIVVAFTGEVASARFTDECELFAVPEQDQLKRKIPTLIYSSGCAHVFGDAGCKFPLASVTYTGTVGAVDSTKSVVTVAAFAALPFSLKGGKFQRGTDVRMVIDHSGATVTLLTGIAGLSSGDAVVAVAGCPHTYPACAAFNNVNQFLGFDMMPTRSPFDGSVV
jgi:uncharacterized phage protein (TIGR02218 family)